MACLVLSSFLSLFPLSNGGRAQPVEGDYARNAEMFILAFRNGAITDYPAALRISGVPGLWDKWKTRMPGLFDNGLDSAAFFSHVLVDLLPRSDGGFVFLFGNFWVNTLVLFRVDVVGKGLKVADFAVLDLNGGNPTAGDWRIVATDLAGLEATVVQRWQTARAIFQNAGMPMMDGTAGEVVEKASGGLSTAEAIARLKEHVKRAREALAPEATADRAPLIAALEQSVKQIMEGAPAATPTPEAITKIRALPAEWRSQLEPSFVLPRADGSAMVVLAAGLEPGHLVLLDLNPVEKGRELKDARLAIMPGSDGK